MLEKAQNEIFEQTVGSIGFFMLFCFEITATAHTKSSKPLFLLHFLIDNTVMSWFKRVKEGILTRTEEKKEAPDGVWSQCTACKKPITTKALQKNAYICTHCGFHQEIGSAEFFYLLFDEHECTEIGREIISSDPLSFTDSKAYPDRIVAVVSQTGLTDAVRSAYGKINGIETVVCCMDFRFIGGSMGSVVGERIKLGIRHALEHKLPVMIISRSGGARMQEGALSLMQMAKISANLALLREAKLPYISLLTHPTTGGVTASYAMLGDLNIAEPNALIGFAGPRVIKETIGKDLPKGFQTSEFLLEHGFLDFIVPRNELKEKLTTVLQILLKK